MITSESVQFQQNLARTSETCLEWWPTWEALVVQVIRMRSSVKDVKVEAPLMHPSNPLGRSPELTMQIKMVGEDSLLKGVGQRLCLLQRWTWSVLVGALPIKEGCQLADMDVMGGSDWMASNQQWSPELSLIICRFVTPISTECCLFVKWQDVKYVKSSKVNFLTHCVKGFPDYYVFVGTERKDAKKRTLSRLNCIDNRYKQIGNAVAPPVAAALGKNSIHKPYLTSPSGRCLLLAASGELERDEDVIKTLDKKMVNVRLPKPSPWLDPLSAGPSGSKRRRFEVLCWRDYISSEIWNDRKRRGWSYWFWRRILHLWARRTRGSLINIMFQTTLKTSNYYANNVKQELDF